MISSGEMGVMFGSKFEGPLCAAQESKGLIGDFLGTVFTYCCLVGLNWPGAIFSELGVIMALECSICT